MDNSPVDQMILAGLRARYRNSLLDWLDPVFEDQILSMYEMHRFIRCDLEVAEAITRSAARSGIFLDK
jgi:hypothetical protein